MSSGPPRVCDPESGSGIEALRLPDYADIEPSPGKRCYIGKCDEDDRLLVKIRPSSDFDKILDRILPCMMELDYGDCPCIGGPQRSNVTEE